MPILADQVSTNNADLYRVFLPGRDGVFPRTRLTPRGFRDGQVEAVTHLVLKVDGEHFAERYPRIGNGTTKGDSEPRRSALLRYLLSLFPKAQIIASGGTDASFHVVLELDDDARVTFVRDRKRFLHLLECLRIIAFCEKIGNGLLPALSARHVGSINSKTGAEVTEIQSAAGGFSVEELERIVDNWFGCPEAELFTTWFGVEPGMVRCPFHDSRDADLKIVDDGLLCFGGNHCAAGKNAARIPMVAKDDGKPCLASLLLADAIYLKRWRSAFRHIAAERNQQEQTAHAQKTAADANKHLLSIDHGTTDDALLNEVRAGFSTLQNLYCDPQGRLLTLEPDRDTGSPGIVYHDTTEKLIALVDRVAVVRVYTSSTWKFRPLPYERAGAMFHRPELRDGLRVLTRVSKNPVLDLVNLRVQPPGYDAATKVFYDGPPVVVPEDSRTPVLDVLLSGWTGFCGSRFRSCKSAQDVAHLYAGVFTEVLADTRLFTLHRHPLLRGNQKGVGKDKYGEALGIIRDGETPADLNHSDENRINQGFGNGIHSGRRCFQVSNIKCSGAYANTMLTRWLTSESLTGPKHGGGTWRISPNTATVVFTINQGSIDYDLLDRLLPINLEVSGNAKKRNFKLDPKKFVEGHRLEIVGEVLGLALQCLRAGDVWEIPEGVDRRFERWMQVIGAMLERRGLPGFMQEALEVEDELNDDAREFAELAARIYAAHGEQWVRPREIVALCKAGDASRRPLFQDVLREGAPERALSRYVLLRMIGEPVPLPGTGEAPGPVVVLRTETDAKHKSSRYRLEILRPDAPESGGDAGGDTTCSGGDERLSPPNNPGNPVNLAGMAGIENASPPASPPVQPCDTNGVKPSGGDGGDKPIEGATEKDLDTKTTTNNGSISPLCSNPLGAIPAIPAKPLESGTDPWEGVTL